MLPFQYESLSNTNEVSKPVRGKCVRRADPPEGGRPEAGAARDRATVRHEPCLSHTYQGVRRYECRYSRTRDPGPQACQLQDKLFPAQLVYRHVIGPIRLGLMTPR